jgi:hypothetical protein
VFPAVQELLALQGLSVQHVLQAPAITSLELQAASLVLVLRIPILLETLNASNVLRILLLQLVEELLDVFPLDRALDSEI